MTIEMMIEAHLVLNITTQRSSWLLADFSLFLEHDHGHHHDRDRHYHGYHHQHCYLCHLCPSWKRLNSTSVGSRTVSRVAVWWA